MGKLKLNAIIITEYLKTFEKNHSRKSNQEHTKHNKIKTRNIISTFPSQSPTCYAISFFFNYLVLINFFVI